MCCDNINNPKYYLLRRKNNEVKATFMEAEG